MSMPGLMDHRNERDEYYDLVEANQLIAIGNDQEYTQAIRMAEGLLDRCTLSDGARKYLEALTKLIEFYEADAEPIGDASDAAVLAHLLEAKGVKQSDLAKATGIVATTISGVLHRNRKFTREQVGKVCGYFRVPVTVFSFAE